MNRKIFTLILALAVFLGSGLNAQTRDAARKSSGNQTFNKTKKKEVSFDKCDNLSTRNSVASKAQWDILASFTTENTGEQAIGTDGQFFYTAKWQTDGLIGKYGSDGIFVENLTIAGVAAGIRDFCTDGTYFYGRGGTTATSIYKLDFSTNTLVSTITSPVSVRHMSYDPTLDGGNGGFWVGEFATLTKIKKDGTLISDVTVPAAWAGVYGTAYDDVSEGGPFLWAFSQDATAPNVDILKYDIATGTIVATYDASVVPGVDMPNGSAGGLDGSTELVPGKFVLVANFQQDPNMVVVFEIAADAPATAPGMATNFMVTPDAGGALEALVEWTNPAFDVAGNALTELTEVKVFVNGTALYTNTSATIGGAESEIITVPSDGFYTVKIVGYNSAGEGLPVSETVYIGKDVPAAPSNIVLTDGGSMLAQLTWAAPVEGLNGGYYTGAGLTYDVVRYPGAVLVADDIDATMFEETLIGAGNYYYEVTASNAIGEGGTEMSNAVVFGDFLIFETFDVTTLPTDWSVMGESTSNWSVVTTALAGGAANELRFNYAPMFTGRSSVVSPVINTVGMAELTLEFTHFIDYWTHTDPMFVGVATTIDGGNTWTEVWSIDPSVNVGPELQSLVIDNEHIGSENFQFAFFFSGYSYDIDYWYIDNVTLVGELLPGATITFMVEDEAMAAVEGAVVSVNGVEGTTDANGEVSIYVVEGTDIAYTVTKLGYELFESTITVVDGVDADQVVTLTTADSYSVTFTIENANGAPLNADVTIYFEGNVIESVTAVNGEVVFTDVPVASYTYDIVAAGYEPVIGATLVVVDMNVVVAVSLVEIIDAPYGLAYEVLNENIDVQLSWNNATGWSESFETSVPPTDWSVINTNATQNWKQVETVTFTSGDIVPVDGTFQAHLMWAYSHQDEWLKTSLFNVPQNGELVFWSYSGAKNSTYGDNYYVKVSTDRGNSWIILWNAVTDNFATDAVYEEHSVDLSSYAGQDVMLAWHAVDGDGQGLWFAWFIDKVEVKMAVSKSTRSLVGYNVYLDGALQNTTDEIVETAYTFTGLQNQVYNAEVESVYETGASDKVAIEIDLTTVNINNVDYTYAIYPNPSTGNYTITVDRKFAVNVVDITGKIVATTVIDKEHNTINLTNQKAGVYFIELSGDATTRFSVIKK